MTYFLFKYRIYIMASKILDYFKITFKFDTVKYTLNITQTEANGKL